MTRDPTISQGLACSLFERLSTKATFEAGSAIAIPEAARDVTGQDLSPTRKIDNTCFFVKKIIPTSFVHVWHGRDLYTGLKSLASALHLQAIPSGSWRQPCL